VVIVAVCGNSYEIWVIVTVNGNSNEIWVIVTVYGNSNEICYYLLLLGVCSNLLVMAIRLPGSRFKPRLGSRFLLPAHP